jgi:NAD-dependent DNA ligase
MSDDTWAQQAVRYRNEFRQSAGLLVGIVTGLIADGVLNDNEIRFLGEWLAAHDEVAFEWPGDIILARVREILADGVITEEERTHLLAILRDVVGDSRQSLAHAGHVTELAFDDMAAITFQGIVFCLTGNFVYAPRQVCEAKTEERGGVVKNGVSRRVRYLVVGSLGSPEWKEGSFGTKIEKAVQLKREGADLAIVREDIWAESLDRL